MGSQDGSSEATGAPDPHCMNKQMSSDSGCPVDIDNLLQVDWDGRSNEIRWLSTVLGLVALLLGTLYAGPEEWVRRPLPEGQLSIVTTIESIGPVWPVAFGLSGILLVWFAVRGKTIQYGHALCAGAWGLYGWAILVGALLSEPPTPITVGVTAIGMSVVHFFLARHWAELGDS